MYNEIGMKSIYWIKITLFLSEHQGKFVHFFSNLPVYYVSITESILKFLYDLLYKKSSKLLTFRGLIFV